MRLQLYEAEANYGGGQKLAFASKPKIKHYLHLIIREVLSRETHFLNEDVGFRMFGEKFLVDMVLMPKKKSTAMSTIIFEIHVPGTQTFINSNKKPLEK